MSHAEPISATVIWIAGSPRTNAAAGIRKTLTGSAGGAKRCDVETSMARATWNGKVIAESEQTETVEGNVYFPESSLKREYFRPSSTTSTCPWKGQARYMSLLIDGQDNPDAAWYYPDPKPAARKIKGYVAFWRGVEVEK
jgi:uncharacterized protein (DUF427 family)